MKKYRNWLLLAVVMAIVVAACGGGDGEGATTTAGDTATTGGETATTGGETATTAGEETPAGDTGYENLDAALAGEYEGTTVDVGHSGCPSHRKPPTSPTPWSPSRRRPASKSTSRPSPTTRRRYNPGRRRQRPRHRPDRPAQPAQTISRRRRPGAAGDWINIDQLCTDYIESFLDLGSVDGSPCTACSSTPTPKSIVWYPVQAFADAGYEIPTTWDELIALSDQIIADGNGNPWCISIEHGDASGWVATDWIEDILLRTAPVEIYDQWMAHEIPFDHPEVLEAAEYMKADLVHPGLRVRRQHRINATFDRRHPGPDVRRRRAPVLDAQAGRLDPGLLAPRSLADDPACHRPVADQARGQRRLLLLPADRG